MQIGKYIPEFLRKYVTISRHEDRCKYELVFPPRKAESAPVFEFEVRACYIDYYEEDDSARKD